MKLAVVERLALLGILPQEGDFLTLKVVHDLRQALSFTEEEHVEFGLEIDQGAQQIRWKQSAARDVEIPVGPKAISIITLKLEELNKAEKLTPNHMSLYEKFCSPDGGEPPTRPVLVGGDGKQA